MAKTIEIQHRDRPEPVFFPVSLVKLGVLSICTVGLYEIYWFYRNWVLIRARERSSIRPLPRAFFSLIFCYPCFARIGAHGSAVGIAPPLSAGLLAAGWIATTVAWKLPAPFWPITLGAVVFLFPVQSYVNRLNNVVVPGHDPNIRFTPWNWVAVMIGSSLLALAIMAI